jgi:hypothetical protein
MDPKNVSVIPDNEAPPSPPLVVMSINLKTVMNHQNKCNEIVTMSAFVYQTGTFHITRLIIS